MLRGYHHSKGKEIKQGRKGPHFGLEIEFMPNPSPKPITGYLKPFGMDAHRFAAYLERVLLETGFAQRLFMFEHDGSLRDSDMRTLGVELIFRPMSYALIRSLPWTTFFERLNREGLTELGHPFAGMHIHVDGESQDARRKYKMLWHDLLNMPEDTRKYLFGRKSNEYCCGVDNVLEIETEVREFDYTDEEGFDVYYTDTVELTYDLRRVHLETKSIIHEEVYTFMFETRYVPLNLTNFKTMELRVFASPSKGSQVLAAVEFATKAITPDFESRLGLSENYSATEFYASLKSTQLGEKGWDSV